MATDPTVPPLTLALPPPAPAPTVAVPPIPPPPTPTARAATLTATAARNAARSARRRPEELDFADLGPHERAMLRQAARDEAALKSLGRFLRTAWQVVEPGVALIENWHIDAIARELEVVYPGVRSLEPPFGAGPDGAPLGGVHMVEENWRMWIAEPHRPPPLWRGSRLVINIPPGHMKSLLVDVFWPAWIWLHDPGYRSLAIAGSDNLTTRDALKMRAILDSAWYGRLKQRAHHNRLCTWEEIEGAGALPSKYEFREMKRRGAAPRSATRTKDDVPLDVRRGAAPRDDVHTPGDTTRAPTKGTPLSAERIRQAVRRGILGAYAGVRSKTEPWKIDPKKDAKASFGTTLGGGRECKAIGSRITGERGYGWSLDDPIDVKAVLVHGNIDHERVAERCGEVNQIIDTTLMSRLNDKRPGRHHCVLIMQRLHLDDPAGHAARKGWRVVALASRYVPDEEKGEDDPDNYAFDPRHIAHERWIAAGRPEGRTWRDVGYMDPGPEGCDATGAPLFPAMFPISVLDEIRNNELGPDQDDAQHGQAPVPGKGGMLTTAIAAARRYDGDPFLIATGNGGLLGPDGLPVGALEILITIDASFGAKGATASNVAIEVWGRPYRGAVRGWAFWLDTPTVERLDFVETARAIKDAKRRWPAARTILIEEKANGPALISALSAEIPGIVPYDPKGSKTVRAGAWANAARGGSMWLPTDDNVHAPWWKAAKREFERFPGGRRDDQVDAASSAIIYWMEQSPGEDPMEKAKALARGMTALANEVQKGRGVLIGWGR